MPTCQLINVTWGSDFIQNRYRMFVLHCCFGTSINIDKLFMFYKICFYVFERKKRGGERKDLPLLIQSSNGHKD